jgi:uncharacterized protein (TIGR03000 family)
MGKFIAAALMACALGLSTWAPPALAQRGAYRNSGAAGATTPYRGVSNVAGQGSNGYESYLRGNFWPRDFDYGQVYPHEPFRPADVSLGDPLSPSIDQIIFPAPMTGGYYHTDLFQPSYGAAAYSVLAASRRTGAVSRPTSANGSNAATVRVSVPNTNARVTFDDVPTRQAGADRVFVSPKLELGKFYTYTVRATWQENGQEMTRTKEVQVQAGRTTAVDFRGPVDVVGR